VVVSGGVGAEGSFADGAREPWRELRFGWTF
jgi:hypothetical protein